MNTVYLEVTYRHGKPFAAYLYLARRKGDVAATTEQLLPGVMVDRGADGRPIGIEITSPRTVKPADLNRALGSLGLEEIPAAELSPLCTA